MRKMYITNRPNRITENSSKDDWRHVPGKLNPADHGTRGYASCDFQLLWITATSLLIKPDSELTYSTQVKDQTSEQLLVDQNRFSTRLHGITRSVCSNTAN